MVTLLQSQRGGDTLGAMSTSFPKSYILERIDARLASQRSRIPDLEKVVQDEADRARSVEAAWVGGLPMTLRAAATAIGRLKLDTPEAIRKATEQTVDILRQLELTDPGRRSIPFSDKGEKRREQLRKVENAKTALHIIRDEETSLEHARAYLVDTPVDEFSWTALKALGLLDAVKFDLGEAIAQSKSGSRRR
jgi:hypothetical protein